jgi:hypothetical protein
LPDGECPDLDPCPCRCPEGGELECVGVGDGDGDGATTPTEPIAETEPDAVAPAATPVAVPVKVAECPVKALPGTDSRACNWVVWFACRVPSVHVCVPSPLPQTLKTGAPKLLGCAEICTVTLPAVPPVGHTSITNCAVCPGCTVLVTDRTLMQSWVAVEGPDEVVDGLDEVTAGEMLGVGPGGGELGDEDSVWHTPLVPAARTECTLARAAAAVPTHSTATPTKAANAVDPVRPLRRGTPGGDPS